MEKLFAAIDAEGALKRKPGFSFDLRARVSEFFSGFAPRTLAYASVAAALVIMLQAGLIGSILLKSKAPTLASADPVQVESLDLYINFVPQASTEEVTKFLRARQASIVEGPKGAGTYRVRFAVTGLPKEELARLVKDMQQNRNIVSSEFETPAAK
jgi:hypothetical protein